LVLLGLGGQNAEQDQGQCRDQDCCADSKHGLGHIISQLMVVGRDHFLGEDYHIANAGAKQKGLVCRPGRGDWWTFRPGV
jgi:hypothetical protein